MKQFKFGLWLIIAAVLFMLFSCTNQYLSEPRIPSEGTVGRGLAPEGLSASQGEKRVITLSWTQRTDAALYYVYRADSPLDAFVRCGETASNQINFNVAPGSTIYYRVSSVSANGTESLQSAYVKGTSLAQPWITDITGITESGAAVTWYMDNVADDTYKNNLLYTVYCYNGTTEVAQIALDGSLISENRAVFSGLSANTLYEYQVEAYLRSDQSVSEKSDKMDAATARRFRPGPPEKLRATRGTAVDNVELFFELPDMVDIALGENRYDPKPLYFVISKRLYSENHSNEYLKVCSYFGSIPKTATEKGGDSFASYVPGTIVKWTDSTVSRGVEYEYMVQSYVDETSKVISSDDSKAHTVGWALSEGNLSFNDIQYTYNADGTLFASASLPLEFDFDPKGEDYSYVLIEKIEPIEDDDHLNPDGELSKKNHFATHEAIRAHVPAMNLSSKTTEENSGRGVYSYAVEIRLDGASLESTPLDTITTIGKVEVSENTQPVIVEKFSVVDGYKDKFVIKWHYWSNRKYEIFVSDNRIDWTSIHIENPNPVSDEDATDNENHEYIYHDQAPGVTKYFSIQPMREVGGTEKKGQRVYAHAASQTLGVPEISLGGDGASYGTITTTWTVTQKADTYRIKYWYTEDGGDYENATEAATVRASELSVGADNRFRFSFSPFANNTTDVAKAGKEIQIAVDALNEGLWQVVGGNEIATTSTEQVKTRLVGPALIGLSASKAASASEIHVSWNSISGADGYYVFRRQFNMTNTAEAGTEAVVYYVPANVSDANKVLGKNVALENNSKIDTPTVKATASLVGSKYTLTDISIPDNDYNGIYKNHTPAYRDQQNDMAQGYPYRYYVVPIINRGGAPEPLSAIDFTYTKNGTNQNTTIASYTIRENNVDIRYSGASAGEQAGFAIGFGQNVTATKGTHSTETAADGKKINNGIKITWNVPAHLSSVAGFDPRYTLYRRAPGDSEWVSVTRDTNATEYIDMSGTRGVTYEYVVGISGSAPQYYQRFVDSCYALKDDKQRPNMLGFMLDYVRMNNVSRNEIKVGNEFAEDVTWNSSKIGTNPYNWGIDGYTLWFMNRNWDLNFQSNWYNNAGIWRELSSPNLNLIDQTSLTYRVVNDGNTNTLKVLRDYRHYYKVRSYVLNSAGEKIYCPDPPYTWSDGGENDYVKWGARQISANEFAAIASQSIGTAMNWSKQSNAGDRRNDHGVSMSEANTGFTREIKFTNSKPYAVTVNGTLWGKCDATAKTPAEYGADGSNATWIWGGAVDTNPKAHASTLTITGPGDVNGMYSGSVWIEKLKNSAPYDKFRVTYNGQTNFAPERQHFQEMFTYDVASNNYKRIDEYDNPVGNGRGWKPETGWWW